MERAEVFATVRASIRRRDAPPPRVSNRARRTQIEWVLSHPPGAAREAALQRLPPEQRFAVRLGAELVAVIRREAPPPDAPPRAPR